MPHISLTRALGRSSISRPAGGEAPPGGATLIPIPDGSGDYYNLRLFNDMGFYTPDLLQTPVSGSGSVLLPFPASVGGDDQYYELVALDDAGYFVTHNQGSGVAGSGERYLRANDGTYHRLFFRDDLGEMVLDVDQTPYSP